MHLACLYFGLLCLLCFERFGGTLASTNFSTFIKYEDLGGFTCPANETVFDEQESTSLEQCVFKCSRTSTCYGVFHKLRNMRCIGCQEQFLTSDSAQSLNGTLYYRRQTYTVIEKEMIWSTAEKHCEALGGHLADIKSQAEETFIERYHFSGYDIGGIWLGATDIENEGIFRWRDGTNVSDFYVNWVGNQPDNHNDIEHCMMTSKRTAKWIWRDGKCHVGHFSLCKFD